MTFRRQYAGAASKKTLVGDLSSVATSATISDNAGWPNGAVGPFSIVIDRGNGSEEKVLCSAQAANTLTIQTRGYDGTSPQTHSSGAPVEVCVTAIDLDEANAHTSAGSGVHNIGGSVVGDTDSQTLTNKTLIQPVIADHTNAQHDHTSAAQGGSLSLSSAQNFIHSGTYTWSSPLSFVSFNHGAAFAPSTAITQITTHTGGGTDHVWGLVVDGDISTGLIVSFQSYTTGGSLTLNSGTLKYTVFG